MQAIVSLVFAVIPMLIYLWIIWIMDRYDREPLSLLALNFFWGALGAIFFAILFSILTSHVLESDEYIDILITAPVVEEITKGVFLLWTARDRRFDNITDGVVYGMAIGLGFGMTENFLYFLGAKTVGEWVYLVIIRTLFSAVMHAMATGIFGAFVGVTKFSFRTFKIPIRIVGLGIAIFMHFTWNYSVTLNDLGAAGLGALFIVLSLIVILLLIQIALLSENRLIVRELLEESRNGLIPPIHLNYIPYSSKRKLLGWLPPSIDKRRYVQLATQLAFRKAQSRHCNPSEREGYLAEVESLRDEIFTILNEERNALAKQLY